jgi:hypothetical protein
MRNSASKKSSLLAANAASPFFDDLRQGRLLENPNTLVVFANRSITLGVTSMTLRQA